MKNLLNPYHIMAMNPAKFPNVKYDLAMKYINYVISLQGKDIIRIMVKNKYRETLFVCGEDVGNVTN